MIVDRTILTIHSYDKPPRYTIEVGKIENNKYKRETMINNSIKLTEELNHAQIEEALFREAFPIFKSFAKSLGSKMLMEFIVVPSRNKFWKEIEIEHGQRICINPKLKFKTITNSRRKQRCYCFI